jgi:hypothetical protein
MDPMTAMALIKGGESVGKWIYNKFNKPKSFDKTPYGERLKLLKTQGIYSPSMRTDMIGDVGRTTGNVAQGQRTNYLGRLENMGMGNSIAGQRGVNEIESNKMQQVANATNQIDRENELSKVKAADEYAQAKTNYQQMVSQGNQQNNAQLIQGLADAGGTYFKGKIANDKLELDNQYKMAMVDKQKSYYDLLLQREQNKDTNFTPIDFGSYSEPDIMNWINQSANDFGLEQRRRAYVQWLESQQDVTDNN